MNKDLINPLLRLKKNEAATQQLVCLMCPLCNYHGVHEQSYKDHYVCSHCGKEFFAPSEPLVQGESK